MNSPAKTAPKNKFLLYVGDETCNSQLAISNLTSLCQRYLEGRYQIEVVNVFKEPNRALADHVFMTPVLIRLAPAPVRRIVGTLSAPEKFVGALGLDGATS